jgi:environmental stress-induced protein Ves
MRILHAENYRRMRWKNGGGETAEIAAYPEGAGLDDFGWRVSMATVEAGGPFSLFSGVNRTLTILEGDGVVLDIEGRQPVTLTGASVPYGFPADIRTNAELLGGRITDLNVMTRRGLYRHAVSLLEFAGPIEVTAKSAATLLFCRSGDMHVAIGGRHETLGRFDATILSGPQPVRIEGPGQFLLIEISAD